jgi:hypothetical protein
MSPHSKRSRKLGPIGAETQREHVAAILAGLLRAGLKGRPVAAQRRTHGGMWGYALIGNRAFWGIADALRDAGLALHRKGTKGHAIEWEPGEFSYSRKLGGQPTKLWPSRKLLDLAQRHGVTAETARDDWPISRRAETKRIDVPADRLVVCKVIDTDELVRLAPEQTAEVETMRTDVAALNASVAAADIRHCRFPAFRRVFRHDLRLGGRCYAVGGGDTFQQMSEGERARITIGGKPVVEVDITAANLTIFLALTGTRKLPDGDLYGRVALPDGSPLPRAAVKQWMIQSFGRGRLMSRWSRDTPKAATAVRAAVIRDAALRAYPALRNLTAILPADLVASLPPDKLQWAVGQLLTNWEARVIAGALGYIHDYGVVGLPMHDALIVPWEALSLAREGIRGAFRAFLDIDPNLTP